MSPHRALVVRRHAIRRSPSFAGQISLATLGAHAMDAKTATRQRRLRSICRKLRVSAQSDTHAGSHVSARRSARQSYRARLRAFADPTRGMSCRERSSEARDKWSVGYAGAGRFLASIAPALNAPSEICPPSESE